jgi:excisionase family DNA binding protein
MIIETLRKRESTMNIHEVSELLGLSESLLYRMAAAGQIPTVRFCTAVRFDPAELAEWYENRLTSVAAKKVVASERLRMSRIRIAS